MTEDQTLRITQTVSDGFQAKPMKRSVLALFDFSKAYDTVWRADLLGILLNAGTPFKFVKWIKGFLTNRQAKVRLNGEEGHTVLMRQGLPQGSVISPLLFLFVIDGLRACLPTELTVSLYADDVAILATEADKDVAVRKIEEATAKVSEWSKKHKLNLNLNKCEIGVFSSNTHESQWKPEVRLDGQVLNVNPNPVFLGVTYDRSLTFTAQSMKVASRMTKGCRVLGALSNRDWGWSNWHLRRIYQATSLSILKYCAASWIPWLAGNNLDRLEQAQNKCLRVISGQYSSTPIEALRAETDMPSVRTLRDRSAAEAWERSLRLPASNPRSLLPISNVRHRSKIRSSWREVSSTICDRLELTSVPRQPLCEVMIAPWLWQKGAWAITTRLSGGSSCRDTEEVRLADALDTIQAMGHFDYIIYTDGSAEGGVQFGGSAAVVTIGSTDHPEPTVALRSGGNVYTSSFEMEMKALELAAEWLGVNLRGGKALICSDSLSSLMALDKGSPTNPSTALLRQLLQSVRGDVSMQWVPGHCGLPGNELADQEARAAAVDPNSWGDGAGKITMSAAKGVIRRNIHDPPIQHDRTRLVYTMKPGSAGEGRKTDVTLSQLRSGHSKLLASYRARINQEETSCCPRCGEGDEDLDHFIRSCPATSGARLTAFGGVQPELDVLTEDVVAVARYLRLLRLL